MQETGVSIELETLSLKELKDLHARVARAIADFAERKKTEALKQLEEKARELGFSLSELTGATTARKRSSPVAKYANPANPADTWSGRGRKPRWFEAALASGKKPEDMAV
jgi:DNA-binding protein H-NS